MHHIATKIIRKTTSIIDAKDTHINNIANATSIILSNIAIYPVCIDGNELCPFCLKEYLWD